MAAAKMNGGLLGKGTRVKIAPQDWWYVEVEHPMTASGVLRGWISKLGSAPRTDDDKGPTTPLPEAPAPSARPIAAHAVLRKKMAESIVNSKRAATPRAISGFTSFPPATAAVATK